MATVYLAKHQQTDRLVALKLLDPEFSRDPAYVERFRREARAAGRIRSDHVVAIYDLDAEVGGSLVLVMEYLEGQSMQAALKAGRFPIQKAISFGRQMLEGLAAAHEAGVIHRDLKPANLFIERTPTGGEKVKLLDFGISKLADASQQELTRDGQTLGTVAYMAPEQIRGKASATDPRVDLYSAGVSLFIMLTGKRPIDAEDTVQLLAAVLEQPPMTLAQAAGLPFPEPLEAFIAKALEKDPNRRFQTAIEMRDALIEAGRTIGYESTGPLALPSSSTDPSGVVPRVATQTQMGVGGAAPSTAVAKKTIVGMGSTPVPPPTLQQAAPVSALASSAQQTLSAPLPGPTTVPSSTPGATPDPVAHDPFGPMPGGLALPPVPTLTAPTIDLPPEPAPTAPDRKQSRAALVILLSAVGLVALGGAGVLLVRTMNARPSSGTMHVVSPSTTRGQPPHVNGNAATSNSPTLTATSAGSPPAPPPTPNVERDLPTSGTAQVRAQPPQGAQVEQQPQAHHPAQSTHTQQAPPQPAQNPQRAVSQQESSPPSGSTAETAPRSSNTTSSGTSATAASPNRASRPAHAAPSSTNPFDPPAARQANQPTQSTRASQSPAMPAARPPQNSTPNSSARRRQGTTTVVPF
jgi:serine/threonine-protein kinase